MGNFFVNFLNMFLNTFQRAPRDSKTPRLGTCLSMEREARKIGTSSRGCQNIVQNKLRHRRKKKTPPKTLSKTILMQMPSGPLHPIKLIRPHCCEAWPTPICRQPHSQGHLTRTLIFSVLLLSSSSSSSSSSSFSSS